MHRHILAIGGCPQEGDWIRFVRFMAKLTGKRTPRLAVLPTAGGDAEHSISMVKQWASQVPVQLDVISLFRREHEQLRPAILKADAIFVGGGNTVNMLAIWRAHGVDHVLKEAYHSGVVLGGVSAGMICWFQAGMTDSYLKNTSAPIRDGLGLLPGSACPHFDSEHHRRPAYLAAIAGGFPNGIAADDRCGVLYRDEQIAEVITTTPSAKAYRITKAKSDQQIEPLDTKLLPPLDTA